MNSLIDKYVKLLENVYKTQVLESAGGAGGPDAHGRSRDTDKTAKTEGILRCLAKAAFQFETVSESEALAGEYFRGLAGINIGLASHVYHRYASFAETGAESARGLLLSEVRRLFSGFGGEEPFRLRKVLNEARQRIQGGAAAARQDSAYLELLRKVETLADLCFSVLVLEDDELEKEIFGNVGFLIADNDSCNAFIDRVCLLINALDETARGKTAVRFLSYIKRFEWRANDPMVIRMAIRFNLYSTIIGKNHKEEADTFFRELVRRRSYRYFRHAERVFPGVSFDSIGTTAEEFVAKVIGEYPGEISAEELVDGLRVADSLIMRDGEDLQKLDYWWRLVSEAAGGEGNPDNGPTAKAASAEGKPLRAGLSRAELNFFRVYYTLRGLEIDRDGVQSAEFGGSLPETVDIRTLDGLEQRVTSRIIEDCPEKAKSFLEALGEWNYFRFNETETVFKVSVPDDGAAGYLTILSRCCTAEEMVAVYMNSFLRSAVPVNVLLGLIYKYSPNQRSDVLMVKRLFDPYRMVGRIISFRDRIYVEAVSFNTGGKKLRVFRMNDTVRMELEKYYRRNSREKSNVYIHFKITAAMVDEFFDPQVWLDYSEFIPTEMKKLNNSVLESFISALRKVSRSAFADEESLDTLKNTPFIPVSQVIASDIGLEVIRCLDSLPDNRERVELLRGIRCNHYICWRSEKVNYGDLGDKPSLRGFLRDVTMDRGSFEDKFYLYCNTALRANIYFDFFLSRCGFPDRDVPLAECFRSTGIWFRGRTAPSASEEKAGGSAPQDTGEGYVLIPQSVFMAPYHHRKNEYFVETDGVRLDPGTQIRFIIDRLDVKAHRFVIREYEPVQRNNTLFFEGMSKARATISLEGRDLYCLTQKMNPKMLSKNRWKLAVYELEALRLRKDDPEELSRFMELIKEANPWTFSGENLPCVFNLFRGENTDFVEPMVNDFIRDYGGEKTIDLYFNTSLRSVMPLEDFIRTLQNAGTPGAEIWKKLADYPFRFTRWENLFTGNVWLRKNPGDCLGGDPEKGRYIACGYDARKNQVQFSLKDSPEAGKAL